MSAFDLALVLEKYPTFVAIEKGAVALILVGLGGNGGYADEPLLSLSPDVDIFT